MLEKIFTGEDIKLYNIKDNIINGYIPITDAYFHAYSQYEPKTENYIGIAYISGNINESCADFRTNPITNNYNNYIYKIFLDNIKINKIFMWSTLMRPGIWTGKSPYKDTETLIISDDFTVHEFNNYNNEIVDNRHGFDLYTQLVHNPNMVRGPYRTLYPTLDICLLSLYPDNYKDIKYTTIFKTTTKADKEYLDIPIFAECKYYDTARRRDGFVRTFIENGLMEFRPCKNSYIKLIKNKYCGDIIVADKVIPRRTIANPYLGGSPSRPFLAYDNAISLDEKTISINSTPIRFKFGYKFKTYNSVPKEYLKYIPNEYKDLYENL